MHVLGRVMLAGTRPRQGLVGLASNCSSCRFGIEFYGNFSRTFFWNNIRLVADAIVDIVMVTIDQVWFIDRVGAPCSVTGDSRGHGAHWGDRRLDVGRRGVGARVPHGDRSSRR